MTEWQISVTRTSCTRAISHQCILLTACRPLPTTTAHTAPYLSTPGNVSPAALLPISQLSTHWLLHGVTITEPCESHCRRTKYTKSASKRQPGRGRNKFQILSNLWLLQVWVPMYTTRMSNQGELSAHIHPRRKLVGCLELQGGDVDRWNVGCVPTIHSKSARLEHQHSLLCPWWWWRHRYWLSQRS